MSELAHGVRRPKLVRSELIDGLRVNNKRLVANFRMSARMRPYVNRIKPFGIGEFGGTGRAALFAAIHEMKHLLAKKRVVGARARKAIRRTLDAAARHQLDRLRLDQIDAERAHADRKLSQLMRHIRRLNREVSGPSKPALSKSSKGNLNRVVASVDWKNFDSEVYNDLVHALRESLQGASPPRAADKALQAIYGPLQSRKNPHVKKLERSGTPAMIVLWETMPDETRVRVEADLRSWMPPARGELPVFLDEVETLFKRHKPQGTPGRRDALERRYLKAVAGIWFRLDLKIGLAKGGSKHRRPESRYQRFARLALNAIGDGTTVSARQVGKIRERVNASTQCPT